MRTPLRVRDFTAEEERVITKLARSQTASARLVERAKILHLGRSGLLVPQIAQILGLREATVRQWFKRFAQEGLAGLEDAPRAGAPAHYTAEQKAQVLAAARTRPRELGLAYSSWTFERLADYVQKQLGIPMKKTRLFEVLQEEGLRWRKQGTWFGERVDPAFAANMWGDRAAARRATRKKRNPGHRRDGTRERQELSRPRGHRGAGAPGSARPARARLWSARQGLCV